MKLVVENLGAVKKATIDLSKDLLVFTGENNTGKTYLAYAVHALYKHDLSGEGFGLQDLEFDKYGVYQYNLVEALTNQIFLENIVNGYLCKNIKKNLPNHFALDKSYFQNFNLKLTNIENSLIEQEIIDFEYQSLSHDGISISKEKGNALINYKSSDTANNEYLFIKVRLTNQDILFELLFNKSKTYIFPSLREGIVLFNKELSIIKNKTFDKILENRNGDAEIWSSLSKRFNRYPKPVKDSLEFARNLDVYKREESHFAYLADELEDTFLDGKIQIGEDGDVNFKMKDRKEAFEIHAASSTVKSLSYLSVYLRHIAQKGDFIIIDEPELNLHPDNQRKLARFFGRLINEGFKLLISTHSDYIVRELNNLIMLKEGVNNKPEQTDELLKKYNYEKTQLIDKEQVGVYLFRKGKEVENIAVEETGFSVPTIDEEIRKLNQTTNDIIFTVFD